MLSPSASLQNPVDMLASAAPQDYANCLRILLSDPQVDSAMVILPPPPMHTAGGVAKAVIPVIYTADKPVVIALMGERLIQEAVEHFRAARVPDYRFPERAAAALAILVQRAESLAQSQNLDEEPYQAPNMQLDVVRAILAGNTPTDNGFLSPETVDHILAAYGIPIPPSVLVRSADEAHQEARRLGFPLVLKVASPDIPHKSDVGGVLLNLGDETAVEAGFRQVTENARRARPQAEILGAHLQRMIPAGQEVIIGAVRDAQFGALAMFGSGGTEVEGLKDVAFGLAPLPRQEAEQMLSSTWAGRKLKGYRNLPPADRASVLDVLLRLAQLAADFPQFTEIEINPLRVLPEGQGAFAVDARIRLESPAGN